ncbi:MHS family MFS transporter [Actinomycetospora endophytica]|uniref:MHS family MFS transporter n=1 Tax=Actinomycetospora endophytica TaxID=2291215 RepID=A0ABS8PI30_9PSEU|nr:MFS transporter [Actinomycetospora endophytica]MCD2197928.1 MHS family MFS transporter [Actinomycetospora endophytica]
MTSPTPPPTTPTRVALASGVGTAIEWYDFYLYATATALVFNTLFFPSVSPTAGTLAAFATYAAGFGARPIGAIVAGHVGDRVGRKAVLVAALVTMGGATTLIGVLPGYASIGALAPTLLVVLRLLQGFAVGAEWGGAAVLSTEHAPPRRRGWFGSFTQIGSPAGMLLATGSLSLVRAVTDTESFLAWGWRIPFLASAVLVVVGLVIRLRLEDAPEFRALRQEGAVAKLPVVEVLRTAPREVLLTTGLRLSQIGLYTLITTYGLTYVAQKLGKASSAGLLAVVVVSALGLATTPLWALLSDRVGRRRPYLLGSIGGTAGLVLFFVAVDTGSTLLIVLAAVIAINLLHDSMYGPQAAWFAEMFDVRVRYSGASLGYQIGSVLSGGFAPLVAASLLVAGDGRPWWIVLAFGGLSVLTTAAALLAPDPSRQVERELVGSGR